MATAPVTIKIIPKTTSVDEGSSASFTIIASASERLPSYLQYTITGVSAEDYYIYKGNGTITISGPAQIFTTITFSIGLLNDFITEGPETLTLTVGDATASITINDTSNALTPTYSIQSLDSGSTIEGSSANFL